MKGSLVELNYHVFVRIKVQWILGVYPLDLAYWFPNVNIPPSDNHYFRHFSWFHYKRTKKKNKTPHIQTRIYFKNIPVITKQMKKIVPVFPKAGEISWIKSFRHKLKSKISQQCGRFTVTNTWLAHVHLVFHFWTTVSAPQKCCKTWNTISFKKTYFNITVMANWGEPCGANKWGPKSRHLLRCKGVLLQNQTQGENGKTELKIMHTGGN